MTVLQASHRFPVPVDDAGYVEHVREGVRERFGRELMLALSERGGIVGPIHEKETSETDWLWNTNTKTVTYTVYAHVTDLPEPETYRLIGGPADGHIVRTGGVRTWRVPVLRPVTVAPFDVTEPVHPEFAEYDREGDTPVYLFRRMSA